jgi:hypothetical protein
MGLAALFPNRDVVSSPTEAPCAKWSQLLSMERVSARSAIADSVGIPTSSTLGQLIRCDGELGLLIPKRRRDRNRSQMRALAIQLTPKYAMLFYRPAGEAFRETSLVPEAYLTLSREMGICRFTQYSGALLWPWEAAEAKVQISGLLKNRSEYTESIPFFDHGTGDFDCFSDSTGGDVVCFLHERGEFVPVISGPFTNWFEYRLRMALHM